MKSKLLILIVLVSSSSIYGTGVTAASCNADAVHVSSSSGCVISTSAFLVRATPSFSGFTGVDALVEVGFLNEADANHLASAFANASFSETLRSAGSPRLGLATLELLSVNNHGGTTQTSITDGLHDYSLGSCQNLDFNGCAYPDVYPRKTITVPFDLGTDFTISTAASAGLIFTQGSGFEDASAHIPFFGLFEADGVTPVEVSVATPEPSTLFFLLISSLLVLPSLAFRGAQSGRPFRRFLGQ